MLHKFGGLLHTAAVAGFPVWSAKLAAAPDAVKRSVPHCPPKCLLRKDLQLPAAGSIQRRIAPIAEPPY
jgi:hypothetical protein